MTWQCYEAILEVCTYMQLYYSTESHSALMKDSHLLWKYPYAFPLLMVTFNRGWILPLCSEKQQIFFQVPQDLFVGDTVIPAIKQLKFC